MSRTDNTMPGRIQEEDGREPCWTAGGSYRGIGELARRANRRARRRAKVQLATGREPSVDQHRHGEKYVYW